MQFEGSLRPDGSVSAHLWTQEKLLRTGGQVDGEIEGSTRGPRGPKNENLKIKVCNLKRAGKAIIIWRCPWGMCLSEGINVGGNVWVRDALPWSDWSGYSSKLWQNTKHLLMAWHFLPQGTLVKVFFLDQCNSWVWTLCKFVALPGGIKDFKYHKCWEICKKLSKTISCINQSGIDSVPFCIEIKAE